MPRLKTLAQALALALLATAAHADELDDIRKLAEAGQAEVALVRLDELIAARPDAAEPRFLKGTLLLGRGEAAAAREVFLELTRRFPQLPEAHNNLAASYAAIGDYGHARAALDQALATAPDYAAAAANLGDVYLRLAFEAYGRAVELEPGDAAVRAKRNALEKLFAEQEGR